jgi:rare lipoprotein A
VTIRDRGPHVPGRIVDLSTASARQAGIDRHEGVSKVAVTPLALPPAAAAADAHRTPDADAKPAKPGRPPKATPR